MKTRGKIRRSIKAVSPVISVLLMIAIAVAASLIAYAWIMGYIGGTTTKAGKAILIQSMATNPNNKDYLRVYVQNVGQGTVEFDPASCVYINDVRGTLTAFGININPLPVGQTATIEVDLSALGISTDFIKVKVVTKDGTFTETSNTVSVSGLPSGYTLTLIFNPAQGTVGADPAPPYAPDTTVQLTATPQPGWSFYGWSGALTGSNNPENILMNGDKTVTATFTQNQYSIGVTVDPSAGGYVTPDTSGQTYHYNDVVTLTPHANSGYAFDHWSGDGAAGTGNDWVVTVTGNMAATAHFTQNQYSVDVTVTPSSAAGTVTPDVPSPYHYNDVVTLTQVPANGYTFSGWSGAGVDVAGGKRQVTVTGNMAVTAAYTQNQYSIGVTIDPAAGGYVTPDTSGQTYHYNDLVTLTPHANSGYSFDHWSGDGVDGTGGTRVVTVSGDMVVTAYFTIVGNSYSTLTSLGAISTPLVAGQTGVTFSGTVSSSGTAVPNGQNVILQYSATGSAPWTTAATVTTSGGTGAFSGTFTAPSAGTYYFEAYFAQVTSGNNVWQTSTSSQQTIVVNNVYTTTTTLNTIATHLSAGKTGVAFSGSVTSGTAVPNGAAVVLRYSATGSAPWTTAASVATTGGNGAFSGTFTAPASSGTYYFQAYFAQYTSGSDTWQTSTSSQQTITVGIVRVQGPAWQASISQSFTVTLSQTPTSGNVLIAVIGTYRSDQGSNYRTVNSITQTGVTWSRQAQGQETYNQHPTNVEIWLGTVGAGASTSITITLTQSASGGAVADVCEYSGIATSSYLDKIAQTSGSGTSTSTGTTTTTSQASELWIGGITVEAGVPQSSPTNGFSLLDGVAYQSTSVGYLENIVYGTGTANSGTTISSSNRYVGCIATFKGA